MNDQRPRAVNQKIFQMGLPVETVSVYLLCCGLVESGATPTLKTLTEVWNGTAEQLRQGLRTLEQRNVIATIVSDTGENTAYRIEDADGWQCH